MLRWITGVVVSVVAVTAMAEEKRLFNGKDLTGWHGRQDLWSVKDGAITGQTSADKPLKNNTFLVWDGGEVQDFELTFQYKLINGNSGLQYRSKVHSENADTGPIVGGYQADFEAGKTYSGILYEERGRGILAKRGEKVVVKAAPDNEGKHVVEVVGETAKSDDIQAGIKNEDWNEYRIVAQGNHLRHFINGKQTIDVVDEHAAKAAKSGILAFQLHVGPVMTLQIKDVVLKTGDSISK